MDEQYIEFYGQKFLLTTEGRIKKLPFDTTVYDYPEAEHYFHSDAAYILAEAFLDELVIE